MQTDVSLKFYGFKRDKNDGLVWNDGLPDVDVSDDDKT